jgi:putative ABC transport system permease protein
MLRYDKAVETDNPSAEKFSAYSLKTLPDTGYKGEIITLYGISENSRYIDADITGDEVYVSVLMADKLGFEPGDTFTMKEPYDDDTYTFTIGGIYPYEGAMCVFMNRTSLNRTFDYADDFFTGYFSDEKITDISGQYLGTTADIRSLTKVSRQLKTSMGGIMYLVDVFSVILFIILIYLLSRTILEKNAQSISMIKILGYSDREISRLYILSTSVVVIILLFASLPVCSIIIEYLWRTMIKAEMTGWMMYRVNPSVYIKMILLGLSGYTIVSFLEMKKIRKIQMEEALKNME